MEIKPKNNDGGKLFRLIMVNHYDCNEKIAPESPKTRISETIAGISDLDEKTTLVKQGMMASGSLSPVKSPINRSIPVGISSNLIPVKSSPCEVTMAKAETFRSASEILNSGKGTGLREYVIIPGLKLINKNERFCRIKGYEKYCISSEGRVYSEHCKRCREFYDTGDGYKRINLYKSREKKSFAVHRLIAQHFIGKIPERYEVDHLDRTRDHNYSMNLMIKTHKDNMKNASVGGSNRKPVLQYSKYPEYPEDLENPKEFVDEEPIRRFPSATAAAADETVKLKSGNGIGACCRGERKTAGRYRWQFAQLDPEKIFIRRKGENIKCLGIIDGRDFSAYEITDQGRIKHKNRKVERTLCKKSGYDRITLSYKDEDGNIKKCDKRIHRLVAHLFVDGRAEDRNVINHINEVRTANKSSNLEWTTQQENIAHSCGIPVKLVYPNGKIVRYNSLSEAFKKIHITRHGRIKSHFNTGRPRHGYYWYDDSYPIPDTLINSLKSNDLTI